MTIDGSYWKYNGSIPATQSEKTEHLKYEVDMFRSVCQCFYNWNLLSQFEINLLLELFGVHVRVLVDFFYNDIFLNENKKNSGKDRQNQNDIIAQDFLNRNQDWKSLRPPITQILYDAKRKADKQLVHLSIWRIKIEGDKKKSWESDEIKQDIENVIQVFENITNIKL
jgi:hypothetical protein